MTEIVDDLCSFIELQTESDQGGNFSKGEKKNIMSVYAEVGVVRIVRLWKGLRFWSERPEHLHDCICVLYKPC